MLEIPQYIINWGLLVVTAIASWFARQLWDAVQKLKSELSQLQLKIAEDYLPKKEFNGAFKELKDEMRENFRRDCSKCWTARPTIIDTASIA